MDGTQEPVAETFVTGRGDGVLGDFTGELTFDDPTGATHGVLVLTSDSGEDGAPIEASRDPGQALNPPQDQRRGAVACRDAAVPAR